MTSDNSPFGDIMDDVMYHLRYLQKVSHVARFPQRHDAMCIAVFYPALRGLNLVENQHCLSVPSFCPVPHYPMHMMVPGSAGASHHSIDPFTIANQMPENKAEKIFALG
jgi:hypothetical protein